MTSLWIHTLTCLFIMLGEFTLYKCAVSVSTYLPVNTTLTTLAKYWKAVMSVNRLLLLLLPSHCLKIHFNINVERKRFYSSYSNCTHESYFQTKEYLSPVFVTRVTTCHVMSHIQSCSDMSESKSTVTLQWQSHLI